MKQEDKDLLLKDLCARLHCEVKVDHFGTVKELLGIMPSSENVMVGYDINDYEDSFIEDIKPYLRPMSSMTDDEEEEFISFTDTILRYSEYNICCLPLDAIQYLLKNHFDFIGLIPMGLAIEVTEENNPYKL